MRKTIFLTACLAALFSCEVKDTGADIDLSGYTRFDVDLEAVSMPGASPEQRVWKEGDMIGVFGSEQGDNVGFYLKDASEGKIVAEFYGPLVKGDCLIAYFPYDRSVEKTTEGLSCELASVQVYNSENSALQQFLSYSNRAFAVLDDNDEFHFAYPFGMLEVVIALDEAIMISGATLVGQRPLSGKFMVDESLNINQTDVSYGKIDLDFAGGEILSKQDEEYAVLRFVLPPASYSAGELLLEIDVKDGDDMEVNLGDVDVRRIDCSSFSVSTITVGVSDIPELDIKDGYLE